MKGEKYFPGKIMLFGEYSVLEGSHAALIPYRNIGLRLVREPGSDSNTVLSFFTDYIENTIQLKGFIDAVKLREHVADGLAIRSTIPQNKGLGSSGAICSAVYQEYGLKTVTSAQFLRSVFAYMESFFHGKSSGIDPLCIYMNKPVMIANEQYLLFDAEPLNPVSYFLIDTGIQSRTGPLVKHFSELMKSKQFSGAFRMNYIPLVNSAVNQWREGILSMNTLMELSKVQQHYFKRMFPQSFKPVWRTGMDNNLYALKICGSGGGGMLLGFTDDLERASRILKNQYNITIIQPQMHHVI